MSHDQKVMMLLSLMEKCTMDFYCPNLIPVAPVARDKETWKVTWLWGNGASTSWGGVPDTTLWMRFTCCSDLIFLASDIWICRDIRFLNRLFADFEQLEIEGYFAGFGQVKIDITCLFLLTPGRWQLLYWVWT